MAALWADAASAMSPPATPDPAVATPAAAAVADAFAAPAVLCVDDEPNILSAMRRLLRGSGCRVLTAHGGDEALQLLEREPVQLVISDMRMPGMDGAELLSRVRARWPEITRVLLTGYADIGSTISAINRGEIWRYVSKPWDDEALKRLVQEVFEQQSMRREVARLQALTQAQNAELKSLNATLEQRVVDRTAELAQANDRLRRNYLTTIKAFSGLVELRGGPLVGHARRVADLARRTARELGLSAQEAQDIFVAGLLHDIGQIGLPDALLAKPVPKMSAEELQLYRRHPALGEHSLMALEDLQPVAGLIRAHHERHDGQGYPDGVSGEAIPLGARILAVADVFDDLRQGQLSSEGLSTSQALTLMLRGRGTQFDPRVFDAFMSVAHPKVAPLAEALPLKLAASALVPGMRLAKELCSREGLVLLSAGHVLTADLIRRIALYEQREGLTLELQIQPGGLAGSGA